MRTECCLLQILNEQTLVVKYVFPSTMGKGILRIVHDVLDIIIHLCKVAQNKITFHISHFQDELKEILGNNLNSRDLHSILHEEHAPKDTNLNSKHRGKIKNKLKCSIKKA